MKAGKSSANEVTTPIRKVFAGTQNKPVPLVIALAGQQRRIAKELNKRFVITASGLEILLSLRWVLLAKRRQCLGMYSFMNTYGASGTHSRPRIVRRIYKLVNDGFVVTQEGKSRTPGTGKSVPVYLSISEKGLQVVNDYEQLCYQLLYSGVVAVAGDIGLTHKTEEFTGIAQVPDNVLPIPAELRIRQRKKAA